MPCVHKGVRFSCEMFPCQVLRNANQKQKFAPFTQEESWLIAGSVPRENCDIVVSMSLGHVCLASITMGLRQYGGLSKFDWTNMRAQIMKEGQIRGSTNIDIQRNIWGWIFWNQYGQQRPKYLAGFGRGPGRWSWRDKRLLTCFWAAGKFNKQYSSSRNKSSGIVSLQPKPTKITAGVKRQQ